MDISKRPKQSVKRNEQETQNIVGEIIKVMRYALAISIMTGFPRKGYF
jgi:hypothetical protein